MIEELLPLQHRVLIIPKQRQAVCDPRLQMCPCLLRIGGKPERAHISKMLPEPRLHQRQNSLRFGIWFKVLRTVESHRIRGRFAVVMVIVPLSARRGVALHQQARFPAHVTVEIFHPQLLAPLGPIFKFLM